MADYNPDLALSLLPEYECACKLCREACEEAPCWGTPLEIEDLITAGYGKYLALYMVEPGYYNIPNSRGASVVNLIAPARFGHTRLTYRTSVRSSFRGRCVFLHGSGKKQMCELHGVGLKPVEGRLAHHDIEYDDAKMIRCYIIDAWDTDFGREIVRQWVWEYHHHPL